MKQLTLIFGLIFLYAHSYAQTPVTDTGRLKDTGTVKQKALPGKLFIEAAAAFNGLKITGDPSFYETQVHHQVKVSPALQVGVIFPITSTKGALFISPKISFYSLHADGTVELHSGLATFTHESSVQAKLLIKPAVDIGYNFINQPAFKLYAAGGLGALFFAGGKDNQTTTYSSGDQTKVDNTPNGLVFVLDTELGVAFGSHLGLKADYQPAANIFHYVNKKVMFSTLQAGITWAL